MADLTDGERDDIRVFVENEDGGYPEVADLPAWWDATDPDARASYSPRYSARHELIVSYVNWAFTKRWAWDGLHRLLVALEERREPIPEALKDWACSVVSRQFRGALKIPPRLRSPRFAPQDGRDFRIMRIYNVLRDNDWAHENAIGEIALACSYPEDTVGSVIKKMRRFRPFKRSTKGAS